MNISIVIPNYNGEKLLKENLPKLLAAVEDAKVTIEIIIADDASEDNSIVIIEKFIPSIKDAHIHVKIVKSKRKEDRGFSKNVNRGARAANGDIIILLNTDVVPHKNFINPLLDHFKEENVFAVGCMDESIENGKIVLRGRGVGGWKKGFLIHGAGSLDKTNTLWVSGGSGAFRKSIWEKLGGLDELFNPFYWEDIDLSYRAQKAGYKVLFENKSIVIHEHTKGAIQENFQPTRVKKIVYRNQFIFVWVNITDRNLLLSHLVWLPYHLFNAIRSRDSAFITGFIAAFMKAGKIYAYKQHMKRLFVLSDNEVLQQFSEEK